MKDSAHIVIILDRTGSMESIRDDTIGGFNAFLGEQKAQPGSATLTLVQFDSQDPYEVIHRLRPIREVPDLTREVYVPRASTPLLDAMGRGINETEQGLAALPEEERPEKLLFVVVTDGHENASREFRKDQILKMVEEKTQRDGWQFVFLSADLAAIHEAVALGVQRSSCVRFENSRAGTAGAWRGLSEGISNVRAYRQRLVFVPDGQEPLNDAQPGKEGKPGAGPDRS